MFRPASSLIPAVMRPLVSRCSLSTTPARQIGGELAMPRLGDSFSQKRGRKFKTAKMTAKEDLPPQPQRQSPLVWPEPIRNKPVFAPPPPAPEQPLSEATEQGLKLMSMQTPLFAIVEINSKQYKVAEGDQLYLDRLKRTELGDELRLDRIMLVGSKEYTMVGTPMISPSYFDIRATVIEQPRSAYIIVRKHKRRKGYKRSRAYQRHLSILRISRVQVNRHLFEEKKAQEASEPNRI